MTGVTMILIETCARPVNHYFHDSIQHLSLNQSMAKSLEVWTNSEVTPHR